MELKETPRSDVLLMNDSGKEQSKKWLLAWLKEQLCDTSAVNVGGMTLGVQAQHRLVETPCLGTGNTLFASC